MKKINWRRNVFLKKARRYTYSVMRLVIKYLDSGNNNPVIIVNSFPKSGTHLLLQLATEFPAVRDWGMFLASTPSFSFNEVSEEKMSKKIRSMASGEIACAHLFYSEEVAEAIRDSGAIHLFIYRDLRDVVISEAEYLASMNPWHKLHKYYKVLDRQEDRINLAICGLPSDSAVHYPNIAERFSRYQGWLKDANTLCIKYEDLYGKPPAEGVQKIIDFYADSVGRDFDRESTFSNMISAIKPENSHTFRSGSIQGWKTILNNEQKQSIDVIAGPLLERLGYRSTL